MKKSLNKFKAELEKRTFKCDMCKKKVYPFMCGEKAKGFDMIFLCDCGYKVTVSINTVKTKRKIK